VAKHSPEVTKEEVQFIIQTLELACKMLLALKPILEGIAKKK
jgi:hypothetical protein